MYFFVSIHILVFYKNWYIFHVIHAILRYSCFRVVFIFLSVSCFLLCFSYFFVSCQIRIRVLFVSYPRVIFRIVRSTRDLGWLWTGLVQIKLVRQFNPVQPWSWLDLVWPVFTVFENEYEPWPAKGFLDVWSSFHRSWNLGILHHIISSFHYYMRWCLENHRAVYYYLPEKGGHKNNNRN